MIHITQWLQELLPFVHNRLLSLILSVTVRGLRVQELQGPGWRRELLSTNHCPRLVTVLPPSLIEQEEKIAEVCLPCYCIYLPCYPCYCTKPIWAFSYIWNYSIIQTDISCRCWYDNLHCFVGLIWFFTSHQQSFSYIGTGLPGLNQY